MQSPFAIFRKNQKLAMAALVFLAMIAFVFLDPLMQGMSGTAGGNEVLVKFKGGDLRASDLHHMRVRRERANFFIQRAFFSTLDEQQLNNPMIQQQVQNLMFNFGQPTMQQDLVLAHILRLEADKMGIVVSNSAVEDFISQITQNRLSSDQFNEIIHDMQISAKDLFDALRDELRAQIAFRMQAPSIPQTPAEYWKFYQQLNVEQRLGLAAVPVDAFIDQVPNPDDSKLQAFFNQHKNRLMGQPPEYEIGFKQPRRVRLQHLSTSYLAAEKLVPEITDEDVEKYYEENKENYIDRSPVKETPEADEKPATPPADNDTEAPTASSPEGTTPPAKPAPQEGDSQPAKPAAEKPAAEAPATEKPADTKPSDTPAQKPAAPAGEKPAETPKTEEKSEEKSDEQAALNTAQVPALTVSGQSLFAVSDEATEDGKKNEEKGDTPPSEAKPAAPATEKPADASPAPKSEKPAEGTPATETKPADPQPADAQAPATAPATGDAPAAPETPATESTTPPPPPTRYKPLNDELRAEIRDQILRERTNELLRERAQVAVDALGELSLQFLSPPSLDGDQLYVDIDGNGKRDDGEPSIKVSPNVKLESIPEDVSQRLAAEVASHAATAMQKVAKELGMSYGDTGLVSMDELEDLPGLGSAVEMTDNPFDSRGMGSIAETVMNTELLYRATRAQDPLSNDVYVFWKVEDIDEHVPAFADVKDQVLAAWKMQEARPLAEKRARELADKISKSQQPLTEALAGETITGKPDGLSVTVQVTAPFSWLRESAARSTNPFAPSPAPEISEVPGVTNAGPKFMNAVFNELQPGETGVVANDDRSVYYAVKVVERTPGTPEEIEKMRAEFQEEWKSLFGVQFSGFRLFSTPYEDLALVEQRRTFVAWVEQLEKEYAVEYTAPEQQS